MKFLRWFTTAAVLAGAAIVGAQTATVIPAAHATCTVPYTFKDYKPGGPTQTITAGQLNANFNALSNDCANGNVSGPLSSIQNNLAVYTDDTGRAIGQQLQTLFPKANTAWGSLGGLVSVLQSNGIVGVTINNAAPATAIFPVGTVGYGLVYPGASGNTAFGLYGEADLADHGTAVGAEIDCFNYKGTPNLNLPPAQSIGTSENVCVGLQVGAGGLFDGSIGIHIGGALGGLYQDGTAHRWNTGLYIGGFQGVPGGAANQYGIFVDADATGPGTTAVLQNWGTGTNLQLGSIGAYNATLSVIDYINFNNDHTFSFRQNGDLYSMGKAHFTQSAHPAVSSCGVSPAIPHGSDQAGVITVGSGTVTSCTVTFTTVFSQIPACIVTPEAGMPALLISTKSTSAFSVGVASGNMAGANFDYHCFDQY